MMATDQDADAWDTNQQPGGTSQQSGGMATQNKPMGGNRRWILYAVIGVVIVVAILLLLPSGAPTVTQTSSQNSSSIYLSTAQAQALTGSSLSNYSTFDVYNPADPINMSYIVQFVPQLYGNATSGWTTLAFGSNNVTNSSVTFLVITTNNTQSMVGPFGAFMNATIGITPSSTMIGAQGGLSYTYSTYSNSTISAQLLYGIKGSNLVAVVAEGNPGYSMNESQAVAYAASIPSQ